MDAIMREGPHPMQAPDKTTHTHHSTEQAALSIFGAILLQPQLAACIPRAIHAQFSCYGLFLIKACSEGWGIGGIRTALESFGLDGDGITNACLQAVSPEDQPVKTFWRAIQKLHGLTQCHAQ